MTVAIDIHAHVRTGDRVGGDAAFRDAKRLFGDELDPSDPASYYRARDMRAVIFDVDTEVTSGERIDNGQIAQLAADSDGVLIGFGSVDPRKGAAAIKEIERCVGLGLRGIKVHPVTGGFHINEPAFSDVWATCARHDLPLMVHTGTTGIGAGSPGGRGIRLRFGRPVPDIDDVAAEHPDLSLIAAHFAWPWFLEALAVARHKGNVFIDLSGWAPRYLPAEVRQYCNSVIPHKFLFGSDFPLFSPDRWLKEFDDLGMKDEVREKVLLHNAAALVGLDLDQDGAA